MEGMDEGIHRSSRVAELSRDSFTGFHRLVEVKMSVVYVTSDWHFGHTGITKYFRKEFPSLEYMEDHILDNIREVVTKRDILYCLGDMAFTKGALDKIGDAGLPCQKILIRGNHDTLPTAEYLRVFNEVEGAYKYKNYWFTHIPIHPMELYRGMNVHGHCHRGGPYEAEGDTRYFNVCGEFTEYKPVNMQVVGQIITERYNNKMEKRREGKKDTGECDTFKDSI